MSNISLSKKPNMKKFFILTLLTIFAVTFATSCSDDDDDKTIPGVELPGTAKNFIASYFPGDEIIKVERKGDNAGTKYDVKFRSGMEVEFDAIGEWIDVDAPKGRTIPAGIAPQTITEFIEANYPGSGINEISRDYRGYEVELLNGLDLRFNPEGFFIGIDR